MNTPSRKTGRHRAPATDDQRLTRRRDAQRRRYATDPEKVRKYVREWQAKNPEKVRETARRQRERARGQRAENGTPPPQSPRSGRSGCRLAPTAERLLGLPPPSENGRFIPLPHPPTNQRAPDVSGTSLQRVLVGFLNNESVPVDEDEKMVTISIRMSQSERERISALADQIGVGRRKFPAMCLAHGVAATEKAVRKRERQAKAAPLAAPPASPGAQ